MSEKMLNVMKKTGQIKCLIILLTTIGFLACCDSSSLEIKEIRENKSRQGESNRDGLDVVKQGKCWQLSPLESAKEQAKIYERLSLMEKIELLCRSKFGLEEKIALVYSVDGSVDEWGDDEVRFVLDQLKGIKGGRSLEREWIGRVMCAWDLVPFQYKSKYASEVAGNLHEILIDENVIKEDKACVSDEEYSVSYSCLDCLVEMWEHGLYENDSRMKEDVVFLVEQARSGKLGLSKEELFCVLLGNSIGFSVNFPEPAISGNEPYEITPP